MSIALDGIDLPDDLSWSDETASWKVGRLASPTLAGALVIQESAMQVGRPITLQSVQEGTDWIGVVSRATVDALLAKEAIAGAAAMTLTVPRYDGTTATYQVRWRSFDGPAIEAMPVKFVVPVAPTDWYSITLRLVQV